MDEQNKQETITQETESKVSDTNQNYIDAINTLKSTTVSKTDYERVVAENKNLVQSLVNGVQTAPAEAPQDKPSIEELRQKFAGPHASKVSWLEDCCNLRDAILEETGIDPMVGVHHLDPNFDEDDARRQAQEAVDIYRDCIAKSNGSDTMFDALFGEQIIDVRTPNSASRYYRH